MTKEIDDPRRDFLVKALSLGLFAAPNLASLFQPGHARGDIPDQLVPGRSVYQFEGDVTIDGQPASMDSQIGANSVIRTGNRSRIIFVVASDAFILRSNSELQLESDDGRLIEAMRMLSGRILSVFGKREKPHTITTSTATIGIRGTGVYAEAEADRTYFCTCYGAVRIGANASPDASLDIVSEHHDNPVYILSAPDNGELIVPGPFINHTDSELALIEALVGRTPPYAYAGGGYELPRKRSY